MRLLGAAVCAAALVGAGVVDPASAAPDEGRILRAGGSTAIGSYIVVLTDTPPSARAGALAGKHRGRVAATYRHALNGFEAQLSEVDAKRLAAGPAGCSRASNQDVAMPVGEPADSVLESSGCAGNAAANSTVEVHIAGYWRGALVVTLIASDGTPYVLHDREDGFAYKLDRVFTANLSGEARNGAWRLQVRNTSHSSYGRIDTWTLVL